MPHTRASYVAPPRFRTQGIYAESFEKPFLAATAAFYAAESAAALSERDAAGYLAHAEARLAEEAERCAAFLDAPTRKPLLAAVERALVGAHVATLLDKGFAPLMTEGRTGDLARLYALLGRVGAHDALRAALSTCVADAALCAAAQRAACADAAFAPQLRQSHGRAAGHGCRQG